MTRLIGPYPACTVRRGDSTLLIRDVPDATLHTCITSPPYFKVRTYLPNDHPDRDAELGHDDDVDAYVATMVALFREIRRALRDDGTLWLNIGDKWVDGDQAGVPWALAFGLKADGWRLRSDIIWRKTDAPPEAALGRPVRCHEHLFLFTKTASAAEYYFDKDGFREPHESPLVGPTRQDGERAKKLHGSAGKGVRRFAVRTMNPLGRAVRDVWDIPCEKTSLGHYDTFPTALVRRCLLLGTPDRGVCSACGCPWRREKPPRPQDGGGGAEGDGAPQRPLGPWKPGCSCGAPTIPALAFDPFFGTGTLGKAASDLGRDWLGFDLDERNVAAASARTSQLTLGL